LYDASNSFWVGNLCVGFQPTPNGGLQQWPTDENTYRKDFTPELRRAVVVGVPSSLESRTHVGPRDATGYRRSQLLLGWIDGRELRSKLQLGSAFAGAGHQLGEVAIRQPARDVVARGTGYSGRTLDKVDEVAELAESRRTPDDPIAFAVSANVKRKHRTAGELGFAALDAKDLYRRLKTDADNRMLSGTTKP
jgi:hypothetical protein